MSPRLFDDGFSDTDRQPSLQAEATVVVRMRRLIRLLSGKIGVLSALTVQNHRAGQIRKSRKW
jgi:hypothetical protein